MRLEHLLSGGYDSKVVFSCCFKGTKAVERVKPATVAIPEREKSSLTLLRNEKEFIVVLQKGLL